MTRRAPTFVRLPVEPLHPYIDRAGGIDRAYRVVAGYVGCEVGSVKRGWLRAQGEGLTIAQADRWAQAIGPGPGAVWGAAFYQGFDYGEVA